MADDDDDDDENDIVVRREKEKNTPVKGEKLMIFSTLLFMFVPANIVTKEVKQDEIAESDGILLFSIQRSTDRL